MGRLQQAQQPGGALLDAQAARILQYVYLHHQPEELQRLLGGYVDCLWVPQHRTRSGFAVRDQADIPTKAEGQRPSRLADRPHIATRTLQRRGDAELLCCVGDILKGLQHWQC